MDAKERNFNEQCVECHEIQYSLIYIANTNFFLALLPDLKFVLLPLQYLSVFNLPEAYQFLLQNHIYNHSATHTLNNHDRRKNKNQDIRFSSTTPYLADSL